MSLALALKTGGATLVSRFRPVWLISLVSSVVAFPLITIFSQSGIYSLLGIFAIAAVPALVVGGICAVVSLIRHRPPYLWGRVLGGLAVISAFVLLLYVLQMLVPGFADKNVVEISLFGLFLALLIVHDVLFARAGFLFSRFWAWLLWRLPLRAAKTGRRLALAYAGLALILCAGLGLAAGLTHGFRPRLVAPGGQFALAPLDPGQSSLALCSFIQRGVSDLRASPQDNGGTIVGSEDLRDLPLTLLSQAKPASGDAQGATWFLARLPDGSEGYINSSYLEAGSPDDSVPEYGENRGPDAITLGGSHQAIVDKACQSMRGKRSNQLAAGVLVEVKATFSAHSILADDSVIDNADLIQLVDPSCGQAGEPVLILKDQGKAWANPWDLNSSLELKAGTKATLLGASSLVGDVPAGAGESIALAALQLEDGRKVFMDRLFPLFCAVAWKDGVIGARIEPAGEEGFPDPFVHLELWKDHGSTIADQGGHMREDIESLKVLPVPADQQKDLGAELLIARVTRHRSSSDEEGDAEDGPTLQWLCRLETASPLTADGGLAANPLLVRLRSLAGGVTFADRGVLRLRARQTALLGDDGKARDKSHLDIEVDDKTGDDEVLQDFSVDYRERLWAAFNPGDDDGLAIQGREGTPPEFGSYSELSIWFSRLVTRFEDDGLSSFASLDSPPI
jgi:hypothetical protein